MTFSDDRPLKLNFDFKTSDNALIPYDLFSTASANALWRIFSATYESSTLSREYFRLHFLEEVSEKNVQDARSVGPALITRIQNELSNLLQLHPELFADSLVTVSGRASDAFENYQKFLKSKEYDLEKYPFRIAYGYEVNPDNLVPFALFSRRSANSLLRILSNCFDRSGLTEQSFPLRLLDEVNHTIIKRSRGVGLGAIAAIQEELFELVKSRPEYFQSLEFDSETRIANGDAGSPSESNPSLRDPLLLQLRAANDLQDLQKSVISMLVSQYRLDEKVLDILRRRSDLLTDTPDTLEEIGNDWDLTRERIRQIQAKFKVGVYPVLGEVWILTALEKIFSAARSLAEYQDLIVKSGLGAWDDITPTRLVKILTYLDKNEMASSLEYKISEWERTTDDITKSAGLIQKFRNKLGLINLTNASLTLGISKEQVIEVILGRYPNAIFSGFTSLARTKALITMFEASTAKQLLVHSPLFPNEILQGLRRVAAYRGVEIDSSEEDLLDLIEYIAGNPCHFDNLSDPVKLEASLSDLESWMVDQIKLQPGQVMHRDQISSVALKQGLSIGSISAYQSTNPIFRAPAPGMIALVGYAGTLESTLIIREQSLSDSAETLIHWGKTPSGLSLKVNPNMGAFGSGVLMPGREVQEFIGELEFHTQCQCGSEIGIQVIKFTKDKFWTGFTGGFRHLNKSHGLTPGEQINVDFNFRTLSAIFSLAKSA